MRYIMYFDHLQYIVSLYSNKRNKNQPTREIYIKSRVYDGATTSGTHPRKYDNNGKGWYFRYDEFSIYPLDLLNWIG